MRISELSAVTGASARMLRHYESAGLLSPGRDLNGYRRYALEDAKTVDDVRCLLASGLTLSEAAAMLHIVCGDEPNPSDDEREAALAKLDERSRQLDAGIARLLAEKASIHEIRSNIERNYGRA
ncbi:DNA-binding transcriptional MerR regulator [Rhodococcus sp. OK611]|uniref:MerR family transcriptional regulator n=1 Tax=unclassified Rhodococcus (in: high G+C Gram-positive bacteria) TaxID=192944 RepID=UPI000BD89550|nr:MULTISPECIES: MerR family transcriptional regulator [unclassified Rhodococcus (in: high G+C Gram-positive bacteria)]PTR44354.1 DNA-binding transcriptional MerR regulator [Rhodococcus sp. OK611]SNX89795.1 DNA-binding transcriptional regulator, MerR family [Rhodococcus sp. OK270]